MTRLDAVNPATATGETKQLLDAVQAKIGMTPNVLRTLANAPSALKAYLSTGEALSSGKFDAKAREAIALTVAGANDCNYCASAHTALSKLLKVNNDEIAAWLSGHSSDSELDALLVFARKIVEKRGFVDDGDLTTIRAAGHDDGAIVEVIANVTANILTNYVNHVAQTDIDFPKVDVVQAHAA